MKIIRCKFHSHKAYEKFFNFPMDFDWFNKGKCLQNSNQCYGKIDTLVLLASGQKVIKLKTSNPIEAKYVN